MTRHGFAVGILLGVAASPWIAGPVVAAEKAPGTSPAGSPASLPGLGVDLPVDLDGDGTSSFSDRYFFNLWLGLGGNLASALSQAQVVGEVLDLSGFVGSPGVGLAPGVPFPLDQASSADAGAPVTEDGCKAHRDLLRAALAGNEGNADGAEAFGTINHGRKAFNDRTLSGLGGNGRSCADCHMASDNFQLSPVNVAARLAALLDCRTVNPDADDPLFRPIDADDFRVNGANASDFTNLTVNGLVRITFPLPATLRLVDPATGQLTDETHVDVWRARSEE